MRKLLLIVCLLTAAPGWSEPMTEALARKLVGYDVSQLRVSGNWALCQWSMSEAEGMALFHRYGQRWEIAQSGGGAMAGSELAILGVPPADRRALIGSDSAGEVLNEPYWTWLTRKKRITDSDLENHTAWELTLMRNEIFAVHGRTFQDPELRTMFMERPWYHPGGYSDAKLSALERANAEFILSYQKRTGKL